MGPPSADDQVSVGIWYHDRDFDIPPHLRGVAMSMEVFDPKTGRREMLSQASNCNAGWSHSHIYEEGFQPLIPAGAV